MKFDDKKTVKIPSKILVPVVTLAVGVLFAVISFGQYGFWDSTAMKPTKGFFPGIISVALIALSVLAFRMLCYKNCVVPDVLHQLHVFFYFVNT